MKKILALVMAVAMVLSVGSICASAAQVADVRMAAYSCGSKDDFEQVGNIEIDWDPDAATKIDVTDGDMSEWLNSGYNKTLIDQYNMISWESLVHTGTEQSVDENGNPITTHLYKNEVSQKANGMAQGQGAPDSAMPTNWSITTYFVADKDNLYVGFYVVDDDVVAGTEGGAHYQTADAFQISVDFANKLGDIIKNDPDKAATIEETSSLQNIFYSFCYAGDGQPIMVMREKCDNDGFIGESDGIVGATAKTEQGWSAEFSISWERMYEDYSWKSYADENDNVIIGGPDAKPMELGIALFYQNHSTKDGDPNQIIWAAGTCTDRTTDRGVPEIDWTARDNGISLQLPIQEGLEFSCKSILIADEEGNLPETEAPETKAETEAPDAEETKSPDAEETEAPDAEETKKPSGNKGDDDDDDDKDDEKTGCGATLVGGSIAGLMIAAAAAVALKKKD